VLVYALRVPRLVAADWGRGTRTTGAVLRVGILAVSLVLGLTIAVAALPAAGPWHHRHGDEHGHHDD
jgi:hypothetical protein